MTHCDNSHHLKRAATERHDAALRRGRAAIADLDRAGEAITFTAVARAAAVSGGWLYTQPDLCDAILQLRRDRPTPRKPPRPVSERPSTDSLRQRLDTARDEITHLSADNATLRGQLERSLGGQRIRR